MEGPIVVLLFFIALITAFYILFILPGTVVRRILTIVLLGVIALCLVLTVAEMPSFGDPDNPAQNEIHERYVYEGVEDTGVYNIIASVLVDYRALDTLGEATVIFIAIAAVIATLRAH